MTYTCLPTLPRTQGEAQLAELIDRARLNDQRAWTELYEMLVPAMLARGQSCGLRGDEARDVAHRTLLRVVAAYAPSAGAVKPYMWLVWNGRRADWFRSPSNRPGGFTEPPTDPDTGRYLPLHRVDVEDPVFPHADTIDSELEVRADQQARLERWRLVLRTVPRQIESLPNRQRMQGELLALRALVLRDLGLPYSDAELARALDCHQRQAARYVNYVQRRINQTLTDPAVAC